MGQPIPDPTEGFCPACGEPCDKGKVAHDPLCPYKGDDLPPEGLE